jgi:hypothetical protein
MGNWGGGSFNWVLERCSFNRDRGSFL